MKNENLKDKNIKNGKLAVVFPGVGYHADKPLLYYSRKLACPKAAIEYGKHSRGLPRYTFPDRKSVV